MQYAPHYTGNESSHYLGDYVFQHRVLDLYFDDQGGQLPTVIARFSDEPANYTSGLEFAFVAEARGDEKHPLLVAMKRAIEKGFLEKTRRFVGISEAPETMKASVLVGTEAEVASCCLPETIREYDCVNEEHARIWFKADGVLSRYLAELAREARAEMQARMRIVGQATGSDHSAQVA